MVVRNHNISRGHCNGARYTVVAACATLITARKLRGTSKAGCTRESFPQQIRQPSFFVLTRFSRCADTLQSLEDERTARSILCRCT